MELPYDIWAWCIKLATHDQPAGPLAFIMVSESWKRELLHSPALWSQIYIQNDEDEMARIWTFLQLSKSSLLDVYISTVLPTTDMIQLIEPHLSRVRSISFMAKIPHPLTTLHGEQWRQAVSNVMATFSDQLTPWNVVDYSCSGRLIGPDTGVYHAAAMQLLISYQETTLEGSHRQTRDDSTNLSKERNTFSVWENYITRYASIYLLCSPCWSIVTEYDKASLGMPPEDLYVLRLTCESAPHPIYRRCVLSLQMIYPEPRKFCSLYVLWPVVIDRSYSD